MPTEIKGAKRQTAAEKLAAKDAELALLRAQVAAANPAAPSPGNGNGHAPPPPGVPAFEVIRFTTAGKDAAAGPRVTLFSVDGKDYTIPAAPDLRIGLQATRVAARAPAHLAEARVLDFVMTAMLGEDGWTALLDCEDITREQFRLITETCQALTVGALEDPKG